MNKIRKEKNFEKGQNSEIILRLTKQKKKKLNTRNFFCFIQYIKTYFILNYIKKSFFFFFLFFDTFFL